MGRDFIGSQEGRSFRQSPNRDRITRGAQEFPFFSSIRFISTRWGAWDWCIGGNPAPLEFLVSGNRYRRIRFATEWEGSVAHGVLPGSRVDIVEYGDGLSDPVASNLHADEPFTTFQQPDIVTPISATATERRDRVSFIIHDGMGITERVTTLEDPESVDEFKADCYSRFEGMNNYGHRTRLLEPPFTNEYDDRSYWSHGPIAWTTQPDGFLPGVTRVINASPPPSFDRFGGVIRHNPSAGEEFAELGRGSDVFGTPLVPQPPGNGAVARLAVGFSVGLPSVSRPGFGAGVPVLDNTAVLTSFFWQMDLTKVNMQTGQGLVQRYGRRLGVPLVPFTQFDLSQQTLAGGILEPPTAPQVTFYGLRLFDTGVPHFYSRILIPPYALAS